MKVLLIGHSVKDPNSEAYFAEYAAFVRGAVAQDDISVDFTKFDDLYIGVGDDKFTIHDTRHQRDISDWDVIFLRGSYRALYDVITSISAYAHEHNLEIINDYSHHWDSSKLNQATLFHRLKMPVAYSVYVTPAVLAQKHPLGIEFPCVMKATFGSHGDDNHLVKSMAEVVEIDSREPAKKFVLQRFVPNDRDYRILIVGDEVAVISRTAGKDTHLNNTSKGGAAELQAVESIPASIIADAKRVAKHLHMVTAGVDVLADKATGEFYFLEVNAQPQLMTGALTDVKSKMIGDFLRQIKASRQKAETAD